MSTLFGSHPLSIAVIGAGIAGNGAAYALANGSPHRVTLFEKEPRAGGHSHTVVVDYDGIPVTVDTGFIVYNELNYPHLVNLFAHLDVPTVASDMSFSVSARSGNFEWAGRTQGVMNGLFGQRSNMFSASYLRMLLEIPKFNKRAITDFESGAMKGLSLGDYLARGRYSKTFRDKYLVPMGAAIWSMSANAMLAFPAESFVAFFNNHHLLQYHRPVWRTVAGGSRVYVEKLTASFKETLRLASPVRSVFRDAKGATLTLADGKTHSFDHVIFASHSDETLAMLAVPSPDEQSILNAVSYRNNVVYLHRDPALMPRRKRVWSSWNVIQSDDPDADLCVTYWMNALQPIDHATPIFITLNPPRPPAEHLTFRTFNYAHPQFNQAAMEAQQRLDRIQGHNHSWFCGAWTGFGFHEDGLRSGFAVAQALGARLPWESTPQYAEAAE